MDLIGEYVGYPKSFDSSDYFKTPGVNRSSLKYIDQSFKRFIYELFHQEKDPSRAMREGQLMHEIILEPERINKYLSDKEFVDKLSGKYKNPRNTAIYKQWKKDKEDGGIVVLNDLYEGKFLQSAKEILINLKKQDLLAVIASAEKEKEFFVNTDSIIKKCKADLVLETDNQVFVYDIKTTVGMLTHNQVEKYIRKYEVHVQADWYAGIIEKKTKKKVSFHVIMISKSGNFDTICFRITEPMLEVGGFINKWRVKKIQEGVGGHWDVGEKFIDKDLFFPEWYLKTVEESYS